MAKIKSQNTKAELLFRHKLWSLGIRYRVNNKSLLGCPDLSSKKYKVVVFIDGEFWHGYNWEEKKTKIKANVIYWVKKIEKNIERDKKINLYYKEQGWNIFRFWEKDIKINLEQCINEILEVIKK